MTTLSRTTALGAALALSACNRGPTAADSAVPREAALAMSAVAVPSPAPPAQAAPPAAPARVVQTRSLIRSGEVRIKVGDAASAMQRLNAIAAQFGSGV